MSNLVDRCVVVSDVGVFDSSGNIGHAIRDEVETNLNLPLDSLGLHGLTVKGNALFRRSRVRAPRTGATRRTSGDAPVAADVPLTYDLRRPGRRRGTHHSRRKP